MRFWWTRVLEAKLEATGDPQALVADYEQFANTELQRLVGRTLRLTAGIIAHDPRQLLPQLYCRLLAFGSAVGFCEDARAIMTGASLLTFRPSLTHEGAETARLLGHYSHVAALCVLQDNLLISGSDDGTIRLWDLTSGLQIAELESHDAFISDLCLLHGGRLASSSGDGTIAIWDLESGTVQARLRGRRPVHALALLADGRLAAGSYANAITLWDFERGGRWRS